MTSIRRVACPWRCSRASARDSCDGYGPVEGVFSDDLDGRLAWVGHLDESYVAVQGPPGTGKTYSGSHIIHALITAGKRVGITAMSHAAIDNLFAATYEVFAEKGELQ